MIKVIFFDWGYTLATFSKDRKKKLDKLLKPLGLNWLKLRPYWRQFYILRSAGSIKTDKEFGKYIKRVLQKDIPVDKIIEITIRENVIPKHHIEVVKKLKKDYKVGILSNNVEGWVRPVIKNYKIGNLFDAVIISSRVGARKPDAIIYYEALKKFSVKPEEAVLIADEVAEDLVGASGAGMKTIWFNNSKGERNENDKKVLKIYQPDGIVKNFKELIPIIRNL